MAGAHPRGQLDQLFLALSDPARRSMVERLTRGPASLGQLAEPLAMSLSAVAQHLSVLQLAGLVRTRKVGRQRICELDAAALEAAGHWIVGRTLWESRLQHLRIHLAEKDPA
jgi:DNA-binding transcriptional ArsR family regulator